jgi:DHA2 family metal-tetracycline-proton antiporter-like MFS transporter
MILMAFFLSWSPLLIGFCMLLTYVGFSLFQTAMINSVSQTLPKNEIGIGMGVFNLVAIISGAVGTAVVGKILDGKWLEIPFLPTLTRGYDFSNLLLIFSMIVIWGGALYMWAFRNKTNQTLH